MRSAIFILITCIALLITKQTVNPILLMVIANILIIIDLKEYKDS